MCLWAVISLLLMMCIIIILISSPTMMCAGSDGVQCADKKEGSYDGGRKCIPNYCGSKAEEKSFLENYEKKKMQRSASEQQHTEHFEGDGVPFGFHDVRH